MTARTETSFITLDHTSYSDEEMIRRSEEFYQEMDRRRTVREFSNRPVDIKVIENIIKTASTAPSGAHKQPWTFCVLTNSEIRKEVRRLAEEEEYRNYHGRMSEEWLDDLKQFRTDWNKPFIENAPYVIVVFKRAYEVDEDGNKQNNYYVNESVGIATGFLLAAIHSAGLAALTHTPSPMNFLAKALNRPENERPFLLIPVGHPAENCKVPDLERKPLKDVLAAYT